MTRRGTRRNPPVVRNDRTVILFPSSIAGNTGRWRADLGITLTSGQVSAWANQGSGGGTVTDATVPTRRPTPTTRNGKDVLQFNSNFLIGGVVVSSLVSAATYSCFMSLESTDSTTAIGAAFANPAPFGSSYISLEMAKDVVRTVNFDGTTDVSPNVTFTPNARHVVLWNHTGGNAGCGLDGAAVTTVASGNTTNLAEAVRLGCNYNNSKFFDGYIREILFYNVALSAEDVSTIIAYMAADFVT